MLGRKATRGVDAGTSLPLPINSNVLYIVEYRSGSLLGLRRSVARPGWLAEFRLGARKARPGYGECWDDRMG